MKYLKFLAVGVFFGILLIKSEAVSWFRIFEMFRFESFHMFGIIGSAVALGAIGIAAIKKWKVKDLSGTPIQIPNKAPNYTSALIGGSIFGLGWALAGACPGPMYVLVGTGAVSMLLVIAAALAGTFVYGLLRDKLPH
ncbi:MAG: YeeE/YedE family protein [Flavobacteriaceae bacterium]|jgi:uncharacterized membrane protein YedE/YeeE|nr:YeeE/YedE family protein [Flavobacteriaceae bacterium]MCI5088989.1 YeeE/YedE family protein [Flavobacteriaceae bacterium]CAI8181368.1 MAG: Uncharacterised protein [SAR116 cluster bacterium]